jgi:hypothetical protein
LIEELRGEDLIRIRWLKGNGSIEAWDFDDSTWWDYEPKRQKLSFF